MNSRILPVLALFIAIGVFFVYVNPMWSGKVAETKAAIKSDEQTLQSAADYDKKMKDLADAKNAIDSASLAKLEQLLPDSVDNVGLILDINALAARSGLSLTNIDIVGNSAASGSDANGAPALQGKNPVSSVDLTLSAIGSYSALKTFLAGLEKSLRLLDVRSITVKGSDTGVYIYQMNVRLYWLH